MREHIKHLGQAAVVTLGLAVMLLSIGAATAHADELDGEVRTVAKQLQCPVCESVSVADSPAELAVQMRSVIRTKLEQGDSKEQIVRYFVDRYGENVLVEPPRHGVAVLVWLGPVVGLLVGTVLLSLWWRRGRAPLNEPATPVQATPSGAADWRVAAAERELEQLGGR